MRNCAIWCIMLLAAADTGCDREFQPAASLPKERTIDLGNGAELEMVLIPAGRYFMGSPQSDKDTQSDENPQHRVRIHKPFYLGKYQITQEQWEAVMGDNPSHFKGARNPVGTE